MMLTLPPRFQSTISVFSFAFRKEAWLKAQLLLVGALICPGSRTICNVLRAVGLSDDKCFARFHRFLSRDKWSAMSLAAVLLNLLYTTFCIPGEPLVFALDDTIERRWGAKITKRAIYRDPVRSSKSHFVKCSGLRWLSLMLLTELPWLEKGMCWALPVITALCPSKRYYEKAGRRAKKLTDQARLLMTWLARRTRELNTLVYVVGDGSFGTYELFMDANRLGLALIAPLKLNSRLYHFPGPQPEGKRGPKPVIGSRIMDMQKRLTDGRIAWKSVVFSNWYGNKDKEMLLTSGIAIWYKSKKVRVTVKWVLIKDPEGKLEPKLLACTNLEASVEDIVRFFVRRWRIEVTFAEVRRHLGVETQRQWSDQAIERSTPCLLGLMSICCLFGNILHQHTPIQPNVTAWYQKKSVSFSDVLTAVRMELWEKTKLPISPISGLMNNYYAKMRHMCYTLIQAVA